MRIIRLTVLFMASILIPDESTSAIVIENPQPKGRSATLRSAMEVLTCYVNRGNAVGVVGDSDGSVIRALRSKHFIPVVSADARVRIGNSETPVYPTSLSVFVVAAVSATNLNELMVELQRSVLWNQYASVLLLDLTSETHYTCAESIEYLWIMFWYGALDAQIMCYHYRYGTMIFNSNPYERYAPKNWIHLLTLDLPTGPFHAFARQYRGKVNCEELSFDKMKNLNGYKFGVIEHLGAFENFDRTAEIMREAMELHIADAIYRSLNVTPVLLNLKQYAHEKPRKTRFDMFQQFFALERPFKADSTISNPGYVTSVGIITQHTGHKSQLNKILSVVDGTSRNLVCLVYIVTLIFLICFMRQSLFPALLNLVRFTTGVGLIDVPQDLAIRIYLACLLMFIVTVQALYTGNLAALLTQHIPNRHANTRQDLADLGYKIYCRDWICGDFWEPVFHDRVVVYQTTESCIPFVLRDPMNACVATEDSLIDAARHHKLHLGRYPIKPYYWALLLRKKSQYERRINKVLGAVTAGDIAKPWSIRMTEMKMSDFEYDEEVLKNVDVKIMTLSELLFAFVILGVGLSCAYLTFIVELLVHSHVRLKRRKRRGLARIWLDHP